MWAKDSQLYNAFFFITLPFMYNELGSLSSTDTSAGFSNKLSNN